MTTPNLAKIERVDLREAWPNEARDFTPWLAENIAELGEALGMDLELQETEAAVGGYSLDVLATDPNQNRPVIIENQLEATNHDHLGKLLTYAAGYDASVIVWLTREFRDEHRQALDWLNQRTGEDTQFFGVVVELLKIDDSRPAPQFRAVATPNGWRKDRDKKPPPESSERYRVFFQSLVDTLREQHNFTKTRRVGKNTRNWWAFSSGYRGFSYRPFLGQKQARVDVYIDNGDGDWNFEAFDFLEERKLEIESDLGATLDWQRLDQARACRIALNWPGIVQDNDGTLSNIQVWMVDSLLKFKQVFAPRLVELAISNPISQE